MEELTFPRLGKLAFRFIAILFVACAIIVSVINLTSSSSAATGVEIATSEDASPDMEPLGPGENGRFYYVDRKTDYVYETRYEGDIVDMQIAYTDSGEIMKSADYYAAIK